MQTTEFERDSATPIKTAPLPQGPLRIKPVAREILRGAAWLFQVRYGLPTDESLVFEQFFEDEFSDWLTARLGADVLPEWMLSKLASVKSEQ